MPSLALVTTQHTFARISDSFYMLFSKPLNKLCRWLFIVINSPLTVISKNKSTVNITDTLASNNSPKQYKQSNTLWLGIISWIMLCSQTSKTIHDRLTEETISITSPFGHPSPMNPTAQLCFVQHKLCSIMYTRRQQVYI